MAEITDNRALMAELKAQAALDPFILNPNGTPIKLPKGFPGRGLPLRIMIVQGVLVQVAFTYEEFPAKSETVHHLSVASPRRQDIPPAVQEAVKALAFGDQAGQAKAFQPGKGRAMQWILTIQNPTP